MESPLDALIAKQADMTAAVEALVEIGKKYPQLVLDASDLIRSSGDARVDAPRQARVSGQQDANAQRVIEHLERLNGESAFVADIAAACSLDAGQVRTVVYDSKHKERFEIDESRSKGNKKRWRLSKRPPGAEGANDNKIGTTAAIQQWLFFHPEGGTAKDIREAIADQVTANNAVINSTLTSMLKRGKLVADETVDAPRVYRLPDEE
ncbi:MAG: hypothetical protein AAGJ46_20790 [Planctomycetota bacterium]